MREAPALGVALEVGATDAVTLPTDGSHEELSCDEPYGTVSRQPVALAAHHRTLLDHVTTTVTKQPQ